MCIREILSASHIISVIQEGNDIGERCCERVKRLLECYWISTD